MASTVPAPPSTNGYSDHSESIYGTIRPQNGAQSNDEFQYVTLAGSVIKSVIPPGKGVKTNYKINTGYGGPKPFNTGPMNPPMRAPQSPSTYPPPTSGQSWAQPQPQMQPKPQMNPYATLPRASAQSQEECRQQCYEYEEKREQSYQERSVFEEDMEVVDATRPHVGNLNWPPPSEVDHSVPTASPLYIPPPGTQHIVPKPQPTEKQQQQWQSRSAPELTVAAKQQVEIESSSDSYTSTCTTTTTTSEEYQRMYQAQVQTQQIYDQYGSDTDYHMDMEVAAMQQDHSYSSSADYYSMQSGRKSAQECIEYLSGPVSTYHLIDMVRAATPKPETPPPKAQRRVEFSDQVQVQHEEKIEKVQEKQTTRQVQEEVVQEQITEEIDSEIDALRIERVSNELKAENRKFTATPEIKIEIPEPKPVPPSKIPNPVPKEWISSMVRALTTAPDTPIDCHWSDSTETKTFESVHLKEESMVKFQDRIEEKPVKPEILDEAPAKGSFISKVLSTAPTDSIKFTDNINDPVPLPEESEPYMPPPIDMKPYLREDFRPKSPLLSALTTAPERMYTPFTHDVCSQLDDLPTPKEKLTMVDALTVASTRCYTPLDPENAAHLCAEENKKPEYEFLPEEETVTDEKTEQRSEGLEVQMNRQLSAFTNLKGYNSVSAFQPRRDSLTSNTSNTVAIPPARHNSMVPPVQGLTEHRDSPLHSQLQRTIQTHSSSQQHHQQQQQILYQQQQQQHLKQSTFQTACASTTTSSHSMNQSQGYQTTCKQTTVEHAASQRKSQETEQKISFPPPCGPMAKKTLLSGLHKPDNIPQYQRNWTVLPTQRPVRTPEPPELRENVPLAFVDTPRELTPSVEPSPVVMQTTSINQHESASHNATRTSESYYQQQQRSSVPIIVTENSGPITMAFQSLDVQNNDHAHPRPFTPSLINKPAPVIPFYQTTDQLVAEECSATQARLYDPRSPSPLPGRTRSPAPGPPPNPLKAIRAPRMKEAELGYRPTQAGSITTGQSYYGAQAAQYQTEQQGQLVSHYQTGYQSGAQTFVDKPEVVQQRQIGDMTMQTRAKESKLSEENRSELQSKTTTQVGNVQIERHRKVIEEFEHTQSAKSMEILKTHGESRQIGKTGFVANQTRRLSGLEQEISAITSQSQAISARAANLREYDETIFPQFHSPEPVSKFPLKPVLPPYDEPQRPTYVISQDATNKLVNRPPGYGTGPAYLAPTASSYATLSSSQGQSAAQSSITASSVSSSAAATAASSNLTTAIPVPAFKPPVPFGGSAPLANISEAPLSNQPQFLTNNQQLAPTNNAYKPTPSIGPAGFKAPPPPSSNLIPNVVNDPSPASAGPNKGGVFGATSAPKRGRGILNKAVGLGARAPLCGCCNSQIRGPFITALGRIWCPDHFVCVNGNCRRALQDIGFVEEKGDLYCEYCFEKFLAPTCNKCNAKIKGDCLNAIGKHFHPECFTCTYCGKLFGNSPFFLEEGEAYCEADWNELFTTKCFACGFPVEAGDRWVEALSHNYHSQCFNCTMCKKNLEGQSFYNKGGRPFCKNHAR